MKNLRKAYLLLIIILVTSLLVLPGCTPKNSIPPQDNSRIESQTQNYPIEIIEGTGNTIIIDRKPEKIISLAPSHTEILYALGLGEKVVGVTQYSDYPEEVKDKPKVGDSFNIDMEKIIELAPDMVIQYWGMDDGLKNQLNNAGITLLTFSPESIDETLKTIQQIGRATDTSDKAEELINGIEEKKNEITEKVKNAPIKKVFYEIEYSSALWTAGEGSFIDEIITLGGGQNIAKDADGAYAQYSVEALIEKDPEIYVTNTFNMELQSYTDIKDRPGFENISAIKSGKIEILDGNILSRPSHRVINALELMAKAIHPELF